jgi:hypothetical protein
MIKYFLVLVAVLVAFDTSPAVAGRFRTRGRNANQCTGVRQPAAPSAAFTPAQAAAPVTRASRATATSPEYPPFGTDVMLGSHRLEDLRDPFLRARNTTFGAREGGGVLAIGHRAVE